MDSSLAVLISPLKNLILDCENPQQFARNLSTSGCNSLVCVGSIPKVRAPTSWLSEFGVSAMSTPPGSSTLDTSSRAGRRISKGKCSTTWSMVIAGSEESGVLFRKNERSSQDARLSEHQFTTSTTNVNNFLVRAG